MAIEAMNVMMEVGFRVAREVAIRLVNVNGANDDGGGGDDDDVTFATISLFFSQKKFIIFLIVLVLLIIMALNFVIIPKFLALRLTMLFIFLEFSNIEFL